MDFDTLPGRRRVMFGVTCHQRGSTSQRNLKERLIIGVGQPNCQRSGYNRDAAGIDFREKSSNARGVEAKLRAQQNLPILRQDARIMAEGQIVRGNQADDLAGRTEGLKQAGHEDVRVQNHDHCGESPRCRRAWRAAAISASTSAGVIESVPR